jgi:hypothetical protein
MMLRMHSRFALAAMAMIVAVSTSAAAPAPALDDLLAQAQRYVAQWVPRLANIVAVEAYEQRMTPQAQRTRLVRLKSEILLVNYPGALTDWMFFRDVAEADGQAIGTNQDRIQYLFANQSAGAAERAGRISNEAVRYSLPGASFLNTNPLLAVALIQAQYQSRLRFTLAEIDRSVAPTARVVRFEEIEEIKETTGSKDKRATPVLLGAAGRVKGSVWIDTESGRILKTEARLGDLAQRSTTTTTFGQDERLGVMVPKEMRTTWRNDNTPVNGTARYSNFRHFQVTAETPDLQLPQ